MPPGKRGPGRGRPKIGTNASVSGAASFRKKRDVTEVRKAQSTLVNFFTTPKTKPSDVMPSSAPGATKSRGSQGVTAGIDDGPTNPTKEDVHSQVIDVANSNGASSNVTGDGSPSSAAKAVRFKLTSHEEDEARGTAPGKENPPEKLSFPARGMKRSRQGTDTESEAEAEPAAEIAASENANDDDDEDVIMSQPSSSPKSDASGSSAHKTCTPPPRIQRAHPNVREEPAMTAAAANPSVPGETGTSSGGGEGATGQDGKEGFVTPARTPPPSDVSSKTTASVSPPDAAAKASSDVLSPPPSQQQQQRGLSEKQEVSIQEAVGRTKSEGKEEQAEPAGSSPRSAPKSGKSNSREIKAGGKKGNVKMEGAEAASPLSSLPSPQMQTQPSVPHPNLVKYLDQLTAVVANADLVDGEDRRQDRRLGLQDATETAVAWKAVGACSVDKKDGDGGRLASSPAIVDATFPEHLTPLLARVVQGSPSPLSELAEEALDVMKSLVPQLALELSTSQVSTKISLVAQRKCYGSQSKKAVIPEDIYPERLWRWEVQLMDLLPADKASLVRQIRSDRANVGKLVKALARLTEVMARCPTDAAKISKEEEKVLAFARKEEVLRRKASLKEMEVARKEQARREKEEAKDEERRAKEEERRKKLEQKNQEKNAKAEEKKRLKAQQAAAAEEERKKQEEAKAKHGTVSLLNFFKAADPTPQDSKENTAPSAMGVLSGGSKTGGSLGCVSSDGDLKLSEAIVFGGGGALVAGSCIGSGGGGGVDVGGSRGPEGRKSDGGFDAAELEKFERRLKEGGEPEELLAKTAKDRTERLRKRKAQTAFQEECEVQIVKPKRIKVTVTVQVGGGGFGEPAYSEAKEVEVRNRMKLLQFHQDYRPPYWGTWSKTSREVTGRRPLGRDTKCLVNYDYDSEADWEEEAQGEDLLSDEEGDKEPEDNLDYKDGWLRQDDEFSDEEIDRFDDDGKGDQSGCGAGASNTPNHDDDSHANKKLSNGAVVIGVGEGVTLGAGAAAAVAAGNAKGNRGDVQQAFVASLMFRREAITGEEARENPALRTLSAYRAVAFPFGGAAVSPGDGGGFPVAVVNALVEKPRRKDTGDGEGGYGSGGDGKDDKGKHKMRKFKDVPDEILASLVEMLHGKTTKREDVVNSFVALHPQCTKKAVHQKVKDVATRERSIRGGTVFVVRQEVMEHLGVEPTTTVELKPSPAEIAAAAAASAQEAGVDSEGGSGDQGSGGAVSTPPRSGKNAKGNSEDKGKLVPPPGQLSLLGFLHTAKGGSAGESSPPSRATPKVLFGPSGAAEAAAAAADGTETSEATGTAKGDSAGAEKDQAAEKKSDLVEEGDEDAKPGGSDDKQEEVPAWRAPGPDENGGWEEWKESEPPMDKPVPICNVLTPSKKVRQLAAARPVLYLGSGTPPPRPVILDNDDDNDGDKTPKTTVDTERIVDSTSASKDDDRSGGGDGTVITAGSGVPESGGSEVALIVPGAPDGSVDREVQRAVSSKNATENGGEPLRNDTARSSS